MDSMCLETVADYCTATDCSVAAAASAASSAAFLAAAWASNRWLSVFSCQTTWNTKSSLRTVKLEAQIPASGSSPLAAPATAAGRAILASRVIIRIGNGDFLGTVVVQQQREDSDPSVGA